LGENSIIPRDIAVPQAGLLRLALAVQDHNGRFRYSTDRKTWTKLWSVLDATVLSDEYHRLGFTGAFTGIFCVDTARHEASVDFEYFSYTPL
jgi:xylan 1,4-beta-xylosidase